MRITFRLALSILVLVLAACQSDRESEQPPGPDLSESEKALLPVSDEQARVIAKARAELKNQELDEKQQAALGLALDALGKRMDLAGREISHKRVQPVEWPDSSLGCPEPGKSYLQVITPGYLVTLSIEGKVHTVHVGGGRGVVCDRIPDELESRRALGQKIMAVYQAARSDLAERLKIDASEVSVTDMSSTTWPDSSLGCPRAGEEYEQGPVKGFVIRLSCRGRQYEYHTDSDGSRFVSCTDLESCHETE